MTKPTARDVLAEAYHAPPRSPGGGRVRLADGGRECLDAPRFCPDCGKPIYIRNEPDYDPRSGVSKDHWVWSCPDVSLTVTHRGIVRASQWADSVHPYGEGRPHWHRAAAPEPPL